MDVKDLRSEAALGDRTNDGNTKFAQGGSALPCHRNKSYQDIGSNSLGKVDAATTRPCAVIGPDRVVPPPASTETYLKKGPTEPWLSAENTYRRPPEYPHKLIDYQHPTRNISPRQTFQENMQRIMVPPSYSSVKLKDDYNFPGDSNVTQMRNNKLNVPPDPNAKYCDVPYNIHPMMNEQKSVRNHDVSASSINSVLTRSAPHGWPPTSANVGPAKPYPQDLCQYPEYPSCAGPKQMVMPRPHRTLHEEPGPVYPNPYYHDGNIRYKPYPTIKDRYPQTRYEYINNYPNSFHPPAPFSAHRYELQKQMPPHPYPAYPQLPIKYLDSRMPDPMMNGYQRPLNTQVNYNNISYRSQMIHPSYGPVPSNCLQTNKFYPYPPDTAKSIPSTKLPYADPNAKIYSEFENGRPKAFPLSEGFYVNDVTRLHHMKAPGVQSNYPPPGHGMPTHPYYRKESIKSYEYNPHFRNMDPMLNINGNLVTRFPTQFSPTSIAISPSDSNTSNDTNQTHGTLHEDFGYVSQSSSTSMRSIDSAINRMPHEYRRYEQRFSPIIKPTLGSSKNEQSSNGSKDKKDIDVRQFLQMWSEGEEEGGENTKEVIIKSVSNNISENANRFETSSQEQLYVLGLVNVPSEELVKYEHIQKVSKLPENIKGYNNIELLHQFEEIIESSNLSNYNSKAQIAKDYHTPSKGMMPMHSISIPSRPLSPLDVEAKISQSVIHKDVGCNFEIKPCSPKMMSVELAAPIQSVVDERIIEKVSNPLVIHNCNENKDDLNAVKCPDNVSTHSNSKMASCKMISSPYSHHNDNMDPAKTNYSIQDLESNSGVCLASLPRLDNDIELNFPEVNQQFINANKVESVITSTTVKELPPLDVERNDLEDHKLESDVNNIALTSHNDKDFSKLSKYRKLKRKGSDAVTTETSIQALRTDSVIIKNPENSSKSLESFPEKNLPTSTKEDEAQEDPINLSVSTDLRENCSVMAESKNQSYQSNSFDESMAIDFTINSNENKEISTCGPSNLSKEELCNYEENQVVEEILKQPSRKGFGDDESIQSILEGQNTCPTKLFNDIEENKNLHLSPAKDSVMNTKKRKKHSLSNAKNKHYKTSTEFLKGFTQPTAAGENFESLQISEHSTLETEDSINVKMRELFGELSSTETDPCSAVPQNDLDDNSTAVVSDDDMLSTKMYALHEGICEVQLQQEQNVTGHEKSYETSITNIALDAKKIVSAQNIQHVFSKATYKKSIFDLDEALIENHDEKIMKTESETTGSVNIDNESEVIIANCNLLHRKELLSPWIQKLILHTEGHFEDTLDDSFLNNVNSSASTLNENDIGCKLIENINSNGIEVNEIKLTGNKPKNETDEEKTIKSQPVGNNEKLQTNRKPVMVGDATIGQTICEIAGDRLTKPVGTVSMLNGNSEFDKTPLDRYLFKDTENNDSQMVINPASQEIETENVLKIPNCSTIKKNSSLCGDQAIDREQPLKDIDCSKINNENTCDSVPRSIFNKNVNFEDQVVSSENSVECTDHNTDCSKSYNEDRFNSEAQSVCNKTDNHNDQPLPESVECTDPNIDSSKTCYEDRFNSIAQSVCNKTENLDDQPLPESVEHLTYYNESKGDSRSHSVCEESDEGVFDKVSSLNCPIIPSLDLNEKDVIIHRNDFDKSGELYPQTDQLIPSLDINNKNNKIYENKGKIVDEATTKVELSTEQGMTAEISLYESQTDKFSQIASHLAETVSETKSQEEVEKSPLYESGQDQAKPDEYCEENTDGMAVEHGNLVLANTLSQNDEFPNNSVILPNTGLQDFSNSGESVIESHSPSTFDPDVEMPSSVILTNTDSRSGGKQDDISADMKPTINRQDSNRQENVSTNSEESVIESHTSTFDPDLEMPTSVILTNTDSQNSSKQDDASMDTKPTRRRQENISTNSGESVIESHSPCTFDPDVEMPASFILTNTDSLSSGKQDDISTDTKPTRNRQNISTNSGQSVIESHSPSTFDPDVEMPTSVILTNTDSRSGSKQDDISADTKPTINRQDSNRQEKVSTNSEAIQSHTSTFDPDVEMPTSVILTNTDSQNSSKQDAVSMDTKPTRRRQENISTNSGESVIESHSPSTFDPDVEMPASFILTNTDSLSSGKQDDISTDTKPTSNRQNISTNSGQSVIESHSPSTFDPDVEMPTSVILTNTDSLSSSKQDDVSTDTKLTRRRQENISTNLGQSVIESHSPSTFDPDVEIPASFIFTNMDSQSNGKQDDISTDTKLTRNRQENISTNSGQSVIESHSPSTFDSDVEMPTSVILTNTDSRSSGELDDFSTHIKLSYDENRSAETLNKDIVGSSSISSPHRNEIIDPIIPLGNEILSPTSEAIVNDGTLLSDNSQDDALSAKNETTEYSSILDDDKGDSVVEPIQEKTECQGIALFNDIPCEKNIQYPQSLFITRRRTLKRSLSDTALNAIREDEDSENHSFAHPCKRSNVLNSEHETRLFAENICQVIQHHRRNSISSIHNEENVSFCILIDNNCIITEECNESEKICFSEVPEECIACVEEEPLNEEQPVDGFIKFQETASSCKYLTNLDDNIDQEQQSEEPWLEDVAHVETVVSDDIAENIVISSLTSPMNLDLEEQGTDDEETYANEHNDKLRCIYGEKMHSVDAHFVDTLYRTPQMNVDKTLNTREYHVIDDYSSNFNNIPLRDILIGANMEEVAAKNSIGFECTSPMSISSPENSPDNRDNNNVGRYDSCDTESVSLLESKSGNPGSPFTEMWKEKDKATMLHLSQKINSVISCESSINDDFSFKKSEENSKCAISSSPEVSSTTSEEKSTGILLTITNYSGSRVSNVNNISPINSISCKYTEKKDYLSSKGPLYLNPNLPARTLITKAAQKYIPPLKETIPDLKVKLPLPPNSLIKLKQMKMAREGQRLNEVKTIAFNAVKPKEPKKLKPKFEDVLKSIDEIQYQKNREKSKKVRKTVPKVVIKKNGNGSHYASTSCTNGHNPDLTGRKWQPWVFLERNHFIDKMALKRKTVAIFSHRKKCYVLPEKFYKYKSVSSSKFVISQPKLEEISSGHLKYTIRLKHQY